MKIFRPFCRYCIDRAVDRGRPLRGFTAWLVARDPQLSRYEAQIRSVDARLRRDLAGHLERPCAEQFDVENVTSNHPLAAPPRAGASPLHTASRFSAKTRFPFIAIAATAVILLVFSVLLTLYPANSDKDRFVGRASGQADEEMPNRTPDQIPPKAIVATSKSGNFSKRLDMNDDTTSSFPALAELQDFLNREDRDSLGEILTLLGRIPRPSEALPLPSRETVYDSLAASNPVCSYLIECYVRPAFEDDARLLHNSGENSGKL